MTESNKLICFFTKETDQVRLSIATKTEDPVVTPSSGSYGHPDLCRRPCIQLARGSCRKGKSCGFCHFSHEVKVATFDSQQRPGFAFLVIFYFGPY